MDAADRRLLNAMQKDVPLVSRTFAAIGERIICPRTRCRGAPACSDHPR
jgi:DNA-binding Lrp family transcriptional regulator